MEPIREMNRIQRQDFTALQTLTSAALTNGKEFTSRAVIFYFQSNFISVNKGIAQKNRVQDTTRFLKIDSSQRRENTFLTKRIFEVNNAQL